MSDEGNDVLPLTDAFVHFGRREVVRGEVRTPLSPNESDLLQYLATRPSQTLSKKELLREVFGYVDGSRSRTLQTTMQRLRQKVENDPAQPVHLVNVYGKGYRFESLAGMSNHSIKSSPSIIGRAKERTRLYEGLEAERCMQVVGQGGIGKTSLAQVQAQLWRSSATVWFCDLSAAKTLSHVLTRLGEVLNLKSVDGPERIGHALQGHGRALLILDNVEQLEEGLSSWITDWLEQTEVLRILVTSRITLELPGGVLRVAPLPRREAQQLFQRRASAADADAVLETTLVEQIVKTLEGIPLAIELAAARLTLLSLAEVAEGVQQQLKLLSGGPSGRHQTMRATIAWSWTLLSPEAQHLLAQTAVFAGGFPVSAVAEVFLEPEAEAGLMELKSQSLIQVQKSALGSRWVSFENVRAFAQEKLEKNVWRADLESRHETWCLRMGERWLDANESGENEAMARLTCVSEPIWSTPSIELGRSARPQLHTWR